MKMKTGYNSANLCQRSLEYHAETLCPTGVAAQRLSDCEAASKVVQTS